MSPRRFAFQNRILGPQSPQARALEPALEAFSLAQRALRTVEDRIPIARELAPLVLDYGPWCISLYRNFARENHRDTALALTRSMAKLYRNHLGFAAESLDGGSPTSFVGLDCCWILRDWKVSSAVLATLGPGARAVFHRWEQDSTVRAKPLLAFFKRLAARPLNRNFRTVSSALDSRQCFNDDEVLAIIEAGGPQALCNLDFEAYAAQGSQLVTLAKEIKGTFRGVLRACGKFALQLDTSTREALGRIWMVAERDQSTNQLTNLLSSPGRTRSIIDSANRLVEIVEVYGVSVLSIDTERALRDLVTESASLAKQVADTLARKDARHEIGMTIVALEQDVLPRPDVVALFEKPRAIFPPVSRWVSTAHSREHHQFAGDLTAALDVQGVGMLPKVPATLLAVDAPLIKELLSVSSFDNGDTVCGLRPGWFAAHRVPIQDLVKRRGSVGIALMHIFGEEVFAWEAKYAERIDYLDSKLSRKGLRDLLRAVPHTEWPTSTVDDLVRDFRDQSAWIYSRWGYSALHRDFVWYHDLARQSFEALGITNITRFLTGTTSVPRADILRKSIRLKRGDLAIRHDPIIIVTGRQPTCESLGSPVFWNSVDRMNGNHDVLVCEIGGATDFAETFRRWEPITRGRAAGIVLQTHGSEEGALLNDEAGQEETLGERVLTTQNISVVQSAIHNLRRGGRFCYSSCLAAFGGPFASNIVTETAALRCDIVVEGSRTIAVNNFLQMNAQKRFSGMHYGGGNSGRVVVSGSKGTC